MYLHTPFLIASSFRMSHAFLCLEPLYKIWKVRCHIKIKAMLITLWKYSVLDNYCHVKEDYQIFILTQHTVSTLFLCYCYNFKDCIVWWIKRKNTKQQWTRTATTKTACIVGNRMWWRKKEEKRYRKVH